MPSVRGTSRYPIADAGTEGSVGMRCRRIPSHADEIIRQLRWIRGDGTRRTRPSNGVGSARIHSTRSAHRPTCRSALIHGSAKRQGPLATRSPVGLVHSTLLTPLTRCWCGSAGWCRSAGCCRSARRRGARRWCAPARCRALGARGRGRSRARWRRCWL